MEEIPYIKSHQFVAKPHQSNIPPHIQTKIKEIHKDLEDLYSKVKNLALINPKLNEVIMADCYFEDNFEPLQDCIHQIECDMEELKLTDFLDQFDIHIISSLKNASNEGYL